MRPPAWDISWTGKRQRKDIQEICDKYKFSIPLDEKAQDLPVSLLQQVEIVKVLYKGADIIILDEPTSVLTPQGIEGLFDAIRFLVGTGKTVLFITHKLKEVMEISDCITVLKNGEVTGNVRPGEVDEAALASLMGRARGHPHRPEGGKAGGGPRARGEGPARPGQRRKRSASRGSTSRCAPGRSSAWRAWPARDRRSWSRRSSACAGRRRGRCSSRARTSPRKAAANAAASASATCPQDRLGEGANVEGSIWQNAIMGYHIAHGFRRRLLLDRGEIDAFSRAVVRQFAVKTPSLETKVRTLSGGNTSK